MERRAQALLSTFAALPLISGTNILEIDADSSDPPFPAVYLADMQSLFYALENFKATMEGWDGKKKSVKSAKEALAKQKLESEKVCVDFIKDYPGTDPQYPRRSRKRERSESWISTMSALANPNIPPENEHLAERRIVNDREAKRLDFILGMTNAGKLEEAVSLLKSFF
jgi:hypothetical protein